MNEIGSEFWFSKDVINKSGANATSWFEVGQDNKLMLSGRTAIDFVLRDILKANDIKTVYFPSYCCQSMLQPFIDQGIHVVFYDVYYDNELKFDININQKCDIFFAMNYFGYSKGRMDSFIEIFKQRNTIVIEDATHSFLSSKSHNWQSDYVIASLRKWFPIISGGIAIKIKGKFGIRAKIETQEEIIRIRELAMLEKERYMNGDTNIEKESFLEKYSVANELLKKDYSLYNIDEKSHQILKNINLQFVINRRKENVKIVYEKLQVRHEFDFIFPELSSDGCPIFVPIIFKNNTERNKLRGHLINNYIYLPVHWPKPNMINEPLETDICNKELSLVIDQRYDEIDMQYLIRRLEEFYE